MRGDPAATVLSRADWQARREAHRVRVTPWIEPRLQRRSQGSKHPVDDFLFEYYSFRPAQLARWHPGPGIALEGPVEHLAGIKGFVEDDGFTRVDAEAVGRQSELLPAAADLIAATGARRPQIGCSALHEWAMVYRLPQEQMRHSQWPLRVSGAAINETVDAVGLRCTHFDAFRFFSQDAVPRNRSQLSRGTQIDFEQPGCLHATMDLYKWGYRLSPLVPAELVADAFALAREGRTLDMRAAPYDLRSLGLDPLAIETPGGRAEFGAEQRELARRGQLLRVRLLAAIDAASQWLGLNQRAS